MACGGKQFVADSPLEVAVTSEPVSDLKISLLAGKMQGISSIPGSRARQRQPKRQPSQYLRANSRRTRAGNFWRPCREFDRTIREFFAQIRDSHKGDLAIASHANMAR